MSTCAQGREASSCSAGNVGLWHWCPQYVVAASAVISTGNLGLWHQNP